MYDSIQGLRISSVHLIEAMMTTCISSVFGQFEGLFSRCIFKVLPITTSVFFATQLHANIYESSGVLGDLIADATTITINTGATPPQLLVAGQQPDSYSGRDADGVAVFDFRSVTVSTDTVLLITGNRPLAIAANDDMAFFAPITIAAGTCGGGAGGLGGTRNYMTGSAGSHNFNSKPAAGARGGSAGTTVFGFCDTSGGRGQDGRLSSNDTVAPTDGSAGFIGQVGIAGFGHSTSTEGGSGGEGGKSGFNGPSLATPAMGGMGQICNGAAAQKGKDGASGYPGTDGGAGKDGQPGTSAVFSVPADSLIVAAGSGGGGGGAGGASGGAGTGGHGNPGGGGGGQATPPLAGGDSAAGGYGAKGVPGVYGGGGGRGGDGGGCVILAARGQLVLGASTGFDISPTTGTIGESGGLGNPAYSGGAATPGGWNAGLSGRGGNSGKSGPGGAGGEGGAGAAGMVKLQGTVIVYDSTSGTLPINGQDRPGALTLISNMTTSVVEALPIAPDSGITSASISNSAVLTTTSLYSAAAFSPLMPTLVNGPAAGGICKPDYYNKEAVETSLAARSVSGAIHLVEVDGTFDGFKQVFIKNGTDTAAEHLGLIVNGFTIALPVLQSGETWVTAVPTDAAFSLVENADVQSWATY